MAQILEWSPAVVFFVAFKLFGIYWATAALMVSCVALMLVHRATSGKFKTMHVVTATVALVLGTATLLLRDPRFIQWKPTLLLGIAAVAFLGSNVVGKQPLARRMLEGVFDQPLNLSRHGWVLINLAWAIWFALLAVANIYVAHNLSESTWVNFKVFGITLAMIVFMVPQVIWLNSRIKPPAPTELT